MTPPKNKNRINPPNEVHVHVPCHDRPLEKLDTPPPSGCRVQGPTRPRARGGARGGGCARAWEVCQNLRVQTEARPPSKLVCLRGGCGMATILPVHQSVFFRGAINHISKNLRIHSHCHLQSMAVVSRQLRLHVSKPEKPNLSERNIMNIHE